jgi:polyferredoxin
MSPALAYSLLADLVLALHVALVLFVVGGLVAVIVGNLRGWRWVNRWWLRLLHAAAIAVVVAEAWLGLTCPLTTLEIWLRVSAGGTPYGGGFIEHWLQALLYYDAPPWVFTAAYTAFAALVAFTWLRFPPRRR